MVPFWVLNIIWHLIFRVPKKGTLILTTTYMILSYCPVFASVSIEVFYHNDPETPLCRNWGMGFGFSLGFRGPGALHETCTIMVAYGARLYHSFPL